MSEIAATVVDLDAARRSNQLREWIADCKKRISDRWPKIDFDLNFWPINSQYDTNLLDINFAPALADFDGKDPAYGLALKCLMAEIAMNRNVKLPAPQMAAWRHLSRLNVPLHQLKRMHLTGLEADLLKLAQASPVTAGALHSQLLTLRSHLDLVGDSGTTERLAWNVSPETASRLMILRRSASAKFKASKSAILDRQIEALSDAQTAMFRGDDRLSAYDRVTLAVMGLNMCSPSRVNEPLCMAVDDRFTIEDYLVDDTESNGAGDDAPLARVHQMLLVKGSKGAAWGAKPILNFMITFANSCIDIIKQHGERSRLLTSWYEAHPETLFLPAELEHLRGHYIDRLSLFEIMQLKKRKPGSNKGDNSNKIWKELHKAGLIQQIHNPKTHCSNGKINTRPRIQVVAWSDLESVLLRRVKQAMEDIRNVTQITQYRGRLSNMLVLFDSALNPYLPSSIKYSALRRRLVQTENDRKPKKGNVTTWEPEATLFRKLDIKMVVNGTIQIAHIGTHDPRRWLTTQALDARLPDVLANKWAKRLDINQLKYYETSSSERKAERAAMPAIKELEDLTQGLQKLNSLTVDYGLKTEIVVVSDSIVSMTSMDEIMRASEDRPVARTSNQIIVVYPQKYGVCLHQHHEKPCRSYKCGPCDKGVVVKGHEPSNDKIRKDADAAFRSIVNQLEPLLIARQRGIADNPETLDEHILTLVREGLTPEYMAKELIARFHEVKDQIKDRAFAIKLHDAFVLTGYVKLLDSPKVRSGALLKYHNPSCHDAPGHERALEARHGGRAAVQARIEAFDQEYPQFGQTALGKQDQRELLETDEEDESEAAND